MEFRLNLKTKVDKNLYEKFKTNTLTKDDKLAFAKSLGFDDLKALNSHLKDMELLKAELQIQNKEIFDNQVALKAEIEIAYNALDKKFDKIRTNCSLDYMYMSLSCGSTTTALAELNNWDEDEYLTFWTICLTSVFILWDINCP